MQGFLNLNKSLDFTSHDCVARVRRLLQLKRVGHGGTLDPAATGVLPIALGRATRLIQFLAPDKAYRATIRFGVTTATDDLEGEVLQAAACPWLDLETVKACLPQFQGQITQIPPRYSAIQVEGKRLYDLARSGVMIEVPSRQVEIYSIQILAWRSSDFPELDLAIDCGAGTYIRAIARDLGEVLKTGGTLANLTRTLSSGFRLEDSLTLEEVGDRIARGQFAALDPEVGLQHLPIITLSGDEARRWCQGQRILLGYPTASLCRVRDDNRFLGIGELAKSDESALQAILIPQVVLEPEG